MFVGPAKLTDRRTGEVRTGKILSWRDGEIHFEWRTSPYSTMMVWYSLDRYVVECLQIGDG